MTRIRFACVFPVAFVLALGTLSAGGWAVITLDDLPERIEAGRAVPLTFMVRQHGVTPLRGLNPVIEASDGTLKVSANATAATKVGQYTATLSLPRAGDWSVTIHSGFMNSKLTLLPLSVVGPGSKAEPALPALEAGRRLFVAKGCVTCHAQEAAASTPALNLGPAIIPQKYRDEFLARVLENPAATLPPSRLPVGQMPNLNLRPQEITALVAFINHGSNETTK